jgi:hypothetical protein
LPFLAPSNGLVKDICIGEGNFIQPFPSLLWYFCWVTD